MLASNFKNFFHANGLNELLHSNFERQTEKIIILLSELEQLQNETDWKYYVI